MPAVDPLAALLRHIPDSPHEALLVRGSITAWNATTGANTVSANAGTYTDLPFVGPLSSLSVGIAVLLVTTPGGPVILGQIRYPPI